MWCRAKLALVYSADVYMLGKEEEEVILFVAVLIKWLLMLGIIYYYCESLCNAFETEQYVLVSVPYFYNDYNYCLDTNCDDDNDDGCNLFVKCAIDEATPQGCQPLYYNNCYSNCFSTAWLSELESLINAACANVISYTKVTSLEHDANAEYL